MFLVCIFLLTGPASAGKPALDPPRSESEVKELVRISKTAKAVPRMAGGPEVPRDALMLSALVESQRPFNDDATGALWCLAHPDGDVKLQDAYLPLLKDDSEYIRGAAATALGTLHDKRATPQLRTLLRAVPHTSLDEDDPAIQSPPLETQHEFGYSSIYSTALMALGDCASVPAILDRKSISFSWAMILRPCSSEARPLLIKKALASDPLKGNADMTIRALYGTEVLESVRTQRNH